MINRKVFFDGIRVSPLPAKLSSATVANINEILDEWERRKLTDLRWLAYILATNLGETGVSMDPVREGFKDTDEQSRAFVKRHKYPYAKVINGVVYYGRGRVQLTWDYNYKALGEILGIDLLRNPDLALDRHCATQIMFEGMIRGTFTRKKLADYFNSKITDWLNARRIINGKDRAAEIAGYAKQFWTDLQLASK
jgi:putative chitinase